MIAVDRHGVVGRTYEEDDEEISCITAVNNNLQIVWNNFAVQFDDECTIFISLDATSSVLANSMKDSYGMQPIGAVKLSDSSTTLSVFYQSSSKKLALVEVNRDLPISQYFSWLSLVIPKNIKSVVTLGSMNMSSYHGDLSESGTLRRLQSTAVTTVDTNCVKSLEIGNIVTGLGAAVLAYCEARSIPSILLVSITSAARSVEASKAYEQAWPIFNQISQCTSLKKPSAKEYFNVVRSDPFLVATENMYC